MASKTLLVAKYEFMKTFRKKGYLFMAFILPALLVAAVFMAMPLIPSLLGGLGGIAGVQERDIGYIDSFGFLEELDGFTELPDNSTAYRMLIDGNISSYFIMEPGYFTSGNITIYSLNTFSLNDPGSSISAFIRDNLLGYYNVSEQGSERISDPANPMLRNVGGGAIGSPSQGFVGFILPYGFSFLLLITVMMSSGYLMQGIGQEKENKTGELLLSSLSADQLLRGKILGYGSLGMIQALAYASAAVLLFSAGPLAPLFATIKLDGLVLAGITYFLMGYALFAVSIAMTASISSSAREAQQTSSLFTMMAVIPIALVSLIVSEPNSPIAVALTYIPYTSPFVMVMRMSLTTVPVWELALSLAILASTILIVAKLAGKIFRMGMLKYDRRASLKEVFGFLKEK